MVAQPHILLLDWWCQKKEAQTMTVEFARNRVAKIRSDRSRQDLNNQLGFNVNKELDHAGEYASSITVR